MKGKFFQLIGIVFLLVSVPVGVYLVFQKTSFFNRASGATANLIVDLSVVEEDKGQVWQNLAQGGEEKNNMLASVVTPIKEIRPEYIRIDHVFDMYANVSKDGAGNINVDWALLDEMIRSISSTGAKPFISLSYMPPSLSSDGDTVSLPRDWRDWEILVQKTVEHISGRGGLNISGTYYEVWNEPDLFGKFKIGGKKNYLDLYIHSAIGASRAGNVNAFKLGGPGSTDLYETWFKKFLELTKGKGTRLDFYSWHKYSKNIEDYDRDLEKVRTWTEEAGINMENVELMITEAGPNSKNDKAYDGNFAAIHQVAVSTMVQGRLDRLFAFEIKDGPGSEKHWGRWGMFTHDKFGAPVAKPRYQAFHFLNRMQGENIPVEGQGSWVRSFAVKSGETYKILIVNYDPRGTHGEETPLTVKNIPYDNFTLRRYNFLGNRNEAEVTRDESGGYAATLVINPNSAFILEILPR